MKQVICLDKQSLLERCRNTTGDFCGLSGHSGIVYDHVARLYHKLEILLRNIFFSRVAFVVYTFLLK